MNLPEVVPDPLPQIVTKDEALLYHVYANERSPKFVAWVPVETNNAALRSGPSVLGAPVPSQNLPRSPTPPVPAPAPAHSRLGKRPESQRKAFWVFLGGILVVIAAGMGGIVGGCIVATKLKRQDHSADARSSLPPVSVAVSAATPRSTSTTPSSTPLPTPTPTPTFANQTAPLGFTFQGFADDNYTGTATPPIHLEGFSDLPFACNSYLWRPNDSSCCITFCENHTQPAGWSCDDQRRAAVITPFPRIWIGCGSAAVAEHSCL